MIHRYTRGSGKISQICHNLSMNGNYLIEILPLVLSHFEYFIYKNLLFIIWKINKNSSKIRILNCTFSQINNHKIMSKLYSLNSHNLCWSTLYCFPWIWIVKILNIFKKSMDKYSLDVLFVKMKVPQIANTKVAHALTLVVFCCVVLD